MSLDLYDLRPEYAALAELPLEAENDHAADTLPRALAAICEEPRDKALSLAQVVKGLETEVRLLEEHTRLLQSRTQARRDRAHFCVG